jgi:hypothetical protein
VEAGAPARLAEGLAVPMPRTAAPGMEAQAVAAAGDPHPTAVSAAQVKVMVLVQGMCNRLSRLVTGGVAMVPAQPAGMPHAGCIDSITGSRTTGSHLLCCQPPTRQQLQSSLPP